MDVLARDKRTENKSTHRKKKKKTNNVMKRWYNMGKTVRGEDVRTKEVNGDDGLGEQQKK